MVSIQAKTENKEALEFSEPALSSEQCNPSVSAVTKVRSCWVRPWFPSSHSKQTCENQSVSITVLTRNPGLQLHIPNSGFDALSANWKKIARKSGRLHVKLYKQTEAMLWRHLQLWSSFQTLFINVSWTVLDVTDRNWPGEFWGEETGDPRGDWQ